ncbi:hypothetical protein WJX82_002974 [Trebouxia sp. C0006]
MSRAAWSLSCETRTFVLWGKQHADFNLCCDLDIVCSGLGTVLVLVITAWAWQILAKETGASSAPLPARTTHRLPVLEAFSLMAAACAALAFLPYIVHSGTSVAPVRPQALAADVSELLVWLFTTAALRLYWHSAHLHQLPLSLILLWCAKAACSVVLAVLQARVTYEHIQLSFQDVLPACCAVIQCLFVAAVLYEHRIAQQELRTWQRAQQAWLPQQDDQGEPVLHVSKNWASWLVFYWVNPLMARGSKRQLQASDLFQLPKALLPSTCSNRLWGVWADEQQAKTLLTAERGHMVQPSLLKALSKAYGLPYLLLGIIKLVNDILNFAGPLLLNVLIRYLETPSEPFDLDPHKAAKGDHQRPWWLPQPDTLAFGLCCAGLLGITSLIKAVLNSHYSYQQGKISCQLRSAITCLVFKKALLINSVDMTLFSSGAVQTLMSVDADRVVNLCVSLHELWSLPAQIAIALYLLYTQVRYAFLAGLAVVVLLIPVNRWLAIKIEAASERMMAHKDARLQLMGELLRGIHQVKLSAWEPRFITKVNEARRGEMQALAVRKYLDALCVYFWAATSLLFSLFTFGLFVLLGHKLTAEVVFTSLALFNVLISPLNSFPWVLNGLVEAVVSVRRLQGFLSSWETKSDWAYHMDNPQDAIPRADSISALDQHERNALAEGLTSEALQMSRVDSSDLYTTINMERSRVVSQFRRQDSSRHGQGHSGRQGVLQPLLSDAAQQHVGSSDLALHEINLTVRSGDLLVVTGEIGAGKSSLLAALLGEMEQRCGHMRVQGTVAYVPQQPWILTGTLRDNILFGKELLPERYQAVVKACALEADIEQMTQGDATLIGDRGVTLSGGQRARLSLARAIYQDCDIYLLDDILAAVDAHVAAWLTTHALTGPMLDAKTRVVCSNASLITVVADQTMRLYKGKVLSSDMSAKLGGSDEAVRGGMSVRGSRGQPSPLSIALGLANFSGPEPVDSTLPAETIEEAAAQMPGAEEGRMIGHVRWQVYTAYMKAVGTGLVLFVLLSLTLMQITRNGNDLWLSYWVSSLDSPHDHHHPQIPASTTFNSTSAILHTLWHDPDSLASGQPWLQPNSLCYSSLPTYTQYTSLGGSMQCHPQMDTVLPTSANTKSSLQTAPPAGVSQSVSLSRHLLAELSRKQPVLDPDTKFYLVVLLCIAAANSVFTFVRAFSFAYVGLVAARKLHEQLLTAVITAPAKFFQTTLPGRVLNRFSSDTATADDALPFTLNILLANIFGLVGTVLVLCLSEPYLLLALIPLAILYKYLQTYYRQTARELRRLNSIARSPVYATFTEALDGAASIRAYDAQHRFCQLNEQQVALSQQAAFAGIAAAQWLGLRLQSIAAFVITLVALLAVLGHQGLLPFAVSDGKFAASLVGLSLAYALPITDRLNGLLTVSAETEQEMVAVERLAEYTDLPPQLSTLHPHSQSDAVELPFQRQGMSLGSDTWPQGGHLQFCGVQLKYIREAPYALAGVSFELRPGQKVGICGRTGAGKSSLVAALLRLTETRAGAILLDGRDCRTVPLQTLRRAIGVVPQTPFLFQGSIRENLDPLGMHSDRHMMSLLKDVGLWDVLAGLSLSRSKAAGQPIPAAITSYASSVASSVPTGTPPRSPLVRPGVPGRLALKPPLHGSAPLGSLSLSTLSVTEEEERLLEEAGSSLTGFLQHPDSASLTSSGHTRAPPETEQGMHGESAMAPEARQDPTSHSASLESSYPVPRRVVPVGATHQGSPSGQGSSRHSPSVQNSRRPQDRKPVIESRSSTEFHIQRQWPNFGGQLLSMQLGEGGMGLSQGQQQLLLDAILECDWAVVMDKGKVVEQGPPQELLKHQSHFAAMYHIGS